MKHDQERLSTRREIDDQAFVWTLHFVILDHVACVCVTAALAASTLSTPRADPGFLYVLCYLQPTDGLFTNSDCKPRGPDLMPLWPILGIHHEPVDVRLRLTEHTDLAQLLVQLILPRRECRLIAPPVVTEARQSKGRYDGAHQAAHATSLGLHLISQSAHVLGPELLAESDTFETAGHNEQICIIHPMPHAHATTRVEGQNHQAICAVGTHEGGSVAALDTALAPGGTTTRGILLLMVSIKLIAWRRRSRKVWEFCGQLLVLSILRGVLGGRSQSRFIAYH